MRLLSRIGWCKLHTVSKSQAFRHRRSSHYEVRENDCCRRILHGGRKGHPQEIYVLEICDSPFRRVDIIIGSVTKASTVVG